jgi:hypothetical protein
MMSRWKITSWTLLIITSMTKSSFTRPTSRRLICFCKDRRTRCIQVPSSSLRYRPLKMKFSIKDFSLTTAIV